MRALVIVVVVGAGCTNRPDEMPRPRQVVPPPSVAIAPVDAGVPADAAPQPPPGFQRVEAPPGGAITRVAVTPAIDAALTVDDTDQVRLWPALDGSVAPIVVELPPARAVALQRDGTDFIAVALVDGGGFVVRLDSRGQRLDVKELPALDDVAAVGAAFVAWQGKAQLELDLEGALTTVTSKIQRPKPPTRVTAKGSDLIVDKRYLGYPYLAGSTGRIGDVDPFLVPGPPGRWLIVDAQLAPVREMVPPVASATDLIRLGGTDWLVESPAGLSIWTEGAATASVVKPKAKLREYDAESRLVLLDGKQLMRYAPDRHALDAVAFTAWGDATVEAHLLTPSRAHGAVLLLTEFRRDAQSVVHGSVEWIHDLADPAHGKTTWSELEAWSAGSTRAGQVLINTSKDAYAGVRRVVDDGVMTGEVSDEMALAPTGPRYLRIDRQARTLELGTRGGSVAWSVALPGEDPPWQYGASWLDDTHAVIQMARGVAVIDLAHGTLGQVASGWKFELANAPHPASRIGRPLAVDLATGRDPPLALAGDATFKNLAGEVAKLTATRVLWWGPVKLGGKVLRVAALQKPVDDGNVSIVFVIEAADDASIAVTAAAWGFPAFQGPWPASDPPWGSQRSADDGTPNGHTIDLPGLEVHTKWIHGSYETITLGLERGRAVVLSDHWTDRDNNGHGYDTTGDDKTFAPGRRPKAESFKGKAIRFAVSKLSRDAAELAAETKKVPSPID